MGEVYDEGKETSKVKSAASAWFSSSYDNLKKGAASTVSGGINLLKGDFEGAIKSYGDQFNLLITNIPNTFKGVKAAWQRVDLADEIGKSSTKIKNNIDRINVYTSELRAPEIDLKQAEDLSGEITSLYQENQSMQLEGLGKMYDNFKDRSANGFTLIREHYKKELEELESYFDQLLEGKTLSFDEIDRITDLLNSMTFDMNVGLSKDQQEEFRSFYVAAIALNREYSQVLEEVNRKLSQRVVPDSLLDGSQTATSYSPNGIEAEEFIKPLEYKAYNPEPYRQDINLKKIFTSRILKLLAITKMKCRHWKKRL
ncbi:MAG: hypothetical protein LIO97_08045 [Tannerellaceae bacterium]|nr:hypothetical protein [Tannerellaceae bacterium]